MSFKYRNWQICAVIDQHKSLNGPLRIRKYYYSSDFFKFFLIFMKDVHFPGFRSVLRTGWAFFFQDFVYNEASLLEFRWGQRTRPIKFVSWYMTNHLVFALSTENIIPLSRVFHVTLTFFIKDVHFPHFPGFLWVVETLGKNSSFKTLLKKWVCLSSYGANA